VGREARGSGAGAGGGGPARARWTRHPKAAPRALPARLAPYFKHMYSSTSGGTSSRQAGRRRSMMGRLQAEGRRHEFFCARRLAFVSVRLSFTRAERSGVHTSARPYRSSTIAAPSQDMCTKHRHAQRQVTHTHTHRPASPPPHFLDPGGRGHAAAGRAGVVGRALRRSCSAPRPTSRPCRHHTAPYPTQPVLTSDKTLPTGWVGPAAAHGRPWWRES
jgi:hypothetical protein